MPEPGGSVHVGGTVSTVVSFGALFIGWWLLLWGGLDQLFGILGGYSSIVALAMGGLLTFVGIAIISIAPVIGAIGSLRGRD